MEEKIVTFKLRIDDINSEHVHFTVFVADSFGFNYTHANAGSLCLSPEEFKALALRTMAYVYMEKAGAEIKRDPEFIQVLASLSVNVYDSYDPETSEPLLGAE